MSEGYVDRFAKRLASRRGAIRATSAGLLAMLMGGTHRAAAQDATPEPTREASFMFVQTATGGSLIPNPQAGTPAINGTPAPAGEADYLLTLEGHHGGTVYFSDRPDRVFGEAPTDQFLDGLGFTPTNPPNAALVTGVEDGDPEVVILELTDPTYDEPSGTLTYGATVLADYDGDGLAHLVSQHDALSLPETFAQASLFIDDCPDITECITLVAGDAHTTGDYPVGPIPGAPYGSCWDWSTFSCNPCSYSQERLNQVCNERYPADCGAFGCVAQ